MQRKTDCRYGLPWATVLAYFDHLEGHREALCLINRLMGESGIWDKFAGIRANLLASRMAPGPENFLLPILLIDGECMSSFLQGTGFSEEFRQSDSNGFIKVVNPFARGYDPARR